MTQRAGVPKFGNWESEDVPYTVYFDKARKGKKGGKMINPNVPQENPDMFPDIAPPPQAYPSRGRSDPEEQMRRHAIRPTNERPASREDGDFRQFNEAPTRHNNTGRGPASGSTHQRRGGHVPGSGQPVKQSAGDGKNSYDSSHGTPGRSRMRPVSRGNESPDKGAAVPRFGEWDETDPSAAENYTHIFNKVRDERHIGSPKITSMDAEQSYNTRQNQTASNNHKTGCFSWCRW